VLKHNVSVLRAIAEEIREMVINIEKDERRYIVY